MKSIILALVLMASTTHAGMLPKQDQSKLPNLKDVKTFVGTVSCGKAVVFWVFLKDGSIFRFDETTKPLGYSMKGLYKRLLGLDVPHDVITAECPIFT